MALFECLGNASQNVQYSRNGLTLHNSLEWFQDDNPALDNQFGGYAISGKVVVFNARLKLKNNIPSGKAVLVKGLPPILGYSTSVRTEYAFCIVNSFQGTKILPLFIEMDDNNTLKTQISTSSSWPGINVSDSNLICINFVYITT